MKKIILFILAAILFANICSSQSDPHFSGHQKTNDVASSPIITWQAFANSMNIRGQLISNSRILNYDENLNVVSFIHPRPCTYSITNAGENNSGVMIARIIKNWNPIAVNGTFTPQFDSTAFASNASHLPTSPNGGIYNPPGNTNINNSYIVGCGPTTFSNAFSGNWFSSKQLGPANYNNTPSNQPNAQQWFGNPSGGGLQGHNLNYNNFSVTDDGKIRSIGKLGTPFNGTMQAAPGDTSLYIATGTFSFGTFSWSGTALHPDFEKAPSTGKANFSKTLMAWNEAGTIGYAIAIGQEKNASNLVNKGMQPKVWKTSNSGASWALIPNLDFTLPTFSMVINDLASTLNTNTNVAVPYFREVEGMDAVVDKDDRLHFATTIVAHASVHPDSVYAVNRHGSDNYYWPHTPGKRPFIYDFTATGSNWAVRKIDSISTEAALATLNEQGFGTGYTENPWTDSIGYKPVSSSRIQLGRTVDGKHVYFTWAESDTLFTNGNKKWNTFPNIKVRVIDVSTNSLSVEMNATSPPTALGTNNLVKHKAFFHSTSPKAASLLPPCNILSIPMTVSNNQTLNGYGDCSNLAPITHYFHAVTISQAGIIYNTMPHINCYSSLYENKKTQSNLTIYPNPANTNIHINFDSQYNLKTEIIISHITGKILKSQMVNAHIGSNEINQNVADLNPGIYFVTLRSGNESTTSKLVVE